MNRIMGADVGAGEIVVTILTSNPPNLHTGYQQHSKRKNNFIGIKLSPKAGEEITALAPDLVILEPTGLYSDPWQKILESLGIPYKLINTRSIRTWQKSEGLESKSDKVDAYTLAAWGHKHINDPLKFISTTGANLRRKAAEITANKRQMIGIMNRIRQHLLLECPALLKVTSSPESGAWSYLANIETRATKKIEIIASSSHCNISTRTRLDAQMICTIRSQTNILEKELQSMMQTPEFSTQLTILEPYMLGPRLLAYILPLCTPIDRLALKSQTIHYYTETGSRQRKRPGLAGWKMQLGLGTYTHQSGNTNRKTKMQGSKPIRALLNTWLVREVLGKPKSITTANLRQYHLAELKRRGRPTILQQQYTIIKAAEMMYSDLITAIHS